MLNRLFSLAALGAVLLLGISTPGFAGTITCGSDGSLCAMSLSIDGSDVAAVHLHDRPENGRYVARGTRGGLGERRNPLGQHSQRKR